MNPVDFAEYEDQPGFTQCRDELSEFRWRRRIVGFTDAGLLYAHEKISQGDHYLFRPALCSWDNVEQLNLKFTWALVGRIGGAVLILCGINIFWAGWIAQTRTGPGIVTLPLLFWLGGGALLASGRRHAITAHTKQAGTLRWLSKPFIGRTEALALCRTLTALAKRKNVLLDSDFDG